MKRGEVYDARLGPTEGSPLTGTRPVIIVSRDVLNQFSPLVLVVPCVRHEGQYLYFSHVLLLAPEGGLDQDSVAMAELVRPLAKERLGQLRGTLSQEAMTGLQRALQITLDLPVPH